MEGITQPRRRRRMTRSKATALYQQFVPMAHDMAKKFALNYRRPYHEVLDDALEVLGTTVALWDDPGASGFDPEKASPSSWVYRAIYWDLTTLYTRKQDKARKFSDLGTEERPLSVEARVGWMDALLRDLGTDAQILLKTIAFAPAEIAEDVSPTSKTRARKAVQRYLTSSGWSPERLQSAWTELELAL